MTQAYFRDGAPNAGTAWEFMKEADTAIAAFLGTTSNGYTRLADLATFLSVAGEKGLTIRSHRFEAEPLNESPSNFPLLYIASYFTGTADKGGGGAVLVRCQTRFTFWADGDSPSDAVERVLAVAGAVAAMIKQTLFDQSGGDWRGFYSNSYPEAGVNNIETTTPPTVVTVEGRATRRATFIMFTNWFHEEL